MYKKKFLLAVFILLLAGCSQTIFVNPELQQVNPQDRISEKFNEKVNLINDQDSNEEKYFSDFTIHKLNGNMHKWTEQVIELTKNELEKRGGFVSKDADKKIFLSFEAKEVEIGSFVYICKGVLSAKTSYGYEKTYSVQNRTPGNVDRACGGAITLSVIELLNDKNIHDFLSTSE